MSPAGKGPLDSLYFDYPVFAARRVPELDGAMGALSPEDRAKAEAAARKWLGSK